MSMRYKTTFNKVIAIVNRRNAHGTINGVIKPNTEIIKFVAAKIKAGNARLIIDTEDTLMYHITGELPKSEIHPTVN